MLSTSTQNKLGFSQKFIRICANKLYGYVNLDTMCLTENRLMSGEVIKTYEFNGEEFTDLTDLNEALAQDFWQVHGDIFGDDKPMLRECFNDWSDMLCKSGLLCNQGYMDCDLIYTVEDAKVRRWI